MLSGSPCATEALTILELDNCPLLTDTTLNHLINCHNLQRIELYDCQLITRAGIQRLKVCVSLQLHLCKTFIDHCWSKHYEICVQCHLVHIHTNSLDVTDDFVWEKRETGCIQAAINMDASEFCLSL